MKSATLHPKRRRWLRFSLRTLLLLTAVIAAWLGVQVNKAQKQRAAVAAIQEAGGKVHYDWENAELDEISERRTVRIVKDIPDETSRWKQYAAQGVIYVSVPAEAVSDEMLSHLKQLRTLQAVVVRGGDPPNLRAALPRIAIYPLTLE